MTQVCVYGTLRKGQRNHHYLQDAIYMGETTIYTGSMVSLGAFPAILAPYGNILTPIEVYSISLHIFQSLDMLEGFPSFYKRTLVYTPLGDSWLYWCKQTETTLNERIPENDWKKYVDNRGFGK